MTIEFYDNKENLLVKYTNFADVEEIEATKELLEFENNCNVTVKLKAN